MTSLLEDRGKQDYRAVPITEPMEKTEPKLTEIQLEDECDSASQIAYSRTMPKLKAQCAGTLSRNNQSSWYFIVQGAVDAGLAIGPIFFFIIAGLCVGLHAQPKAPYGDKIQAVTLLSPTIFPIVYAAILGKLLRRIGLFKAERGTTMGNLERLIGCQSLFSAVERQVGLRRIDLIGFFILAAWMLSPLGGQASLRLLSLQPLFQDTASMLYYWPVVNYENQTALPVGRKNGSNSLSFAPLFVAALQTSRLNLKTPMDLFGNVKIPDLGVTAKIQAGAEHDWHMMPQKAELVYTSVFGIPIAGIPETGTTAFTITTHYWNIECDQRNSTKRMTLWTQLPIQNVTKFKDAKPLSPSFDIAVDRKNSSNDRVRFSYLSRVTSKLLDVYGTTKVKELINTVNCSASLVLVHSRVGCYDQNCQVRAMRTSNDSLSQIWKGNYLIDIFQAISQQLPGVDISATQDKQFGSELIEQWILTPGLDKQYTDQYQDLSALDHDSFVQNLEIVVNTFWDSTVGRNIRTGNLDLNNIQIMQPSWEKLNVTTTKNMGLHYICHFHLAGITMAISFILLLAANLSLLLGLISKTPDALGFVSMAARDNPYFTTQVPSHLDGKEVARMVRDVKVRMGDVKPDDEIGHIALATTDVGPGRLSWSKMYD